MDSSLRAGTLRPATSNVNNKNSRSLRASKQPAPRAKGVTSSNTAARHPVPPPPLPAGVQIEDPVPLLILCDFVEEARELPFDEACCQFGGMADLLKGNAKVGEYQQALAQVVAAAAVLDRLRHFRDTLE